MYIVLWRFRPFKDRESEFERAHGPSGEWRRLFQHGEGYLGTELLRRSDDAREYLVLDRWTSRAATKYSELASAASIDSSMVGWKSSQRKRRPWAPSKQSHNRLRSSAKRLALPLFNRVSD